MGLNFRTSFPTVTSKGGPKCDLLIGLVCDHGTKGTWHREMKPRVYGKVPAWWPQGGPQNWPSSSILTLLANLLQG